MDQNNKKKKQFHRHFATPGLNSIPWSEGGLAIWSGIGCVFWTIIVVTTIVGVTLSFISPNAI